jgi:hypothetical protein
MSVWKICKIIKIPPHLNPSPPIEERRTPLLPFGEKVGMRGFRFFIEISFPFAFRSAHGRNFAVLRLTLTAVFSEVGHQVVHG